MRELRFKMCGEEMDSKCDWQEEEKGGERIVGGCVGCKVRFVCVLNCVRSGF